LFPPHIACSFFLMVCISACVFLYMSSPRLVSFYTCPLLGLCLFILFPSPACVFSSCFPHRLVSFYTCPLLGLCLFPSCTPHIWLVSFYTCPLLGLCLFPLPHSSHMACVFSPSRTPHIWLVSFYCQFLMIFSKKDTCYCTRQNILLPLHSILVHSILE